MANYRNDLESTLAILKALSDESRLRTFLVLQEHELCVCQIIELLQLAPSTVSKHMSILKNAGLVESEKKGRWVYYRIANSANQKGIQQTSEWLMQSLVHDQTIKKDQQTIKKILEIDPDELCRKQCKN
jgi:DNA-binding transcriptional ArsR family regulator